MILLHGAWRLRLRLRLQSELPFLGPALVRGADRLRVRFNRLLYWGYRVRKVPGFLTDVECRHLIGKAGPLLRASKAGEEGGGAYSPGRTRHTAILDDPGDPILQGIRRKIASLTQSPINCQEGMQVTSYRLGQFGAPHFDSGEVEPAGADGGHRAYTVLVYLNEGYDGGHTTFPMLGLRIAPELGKAVVFGNRTTDRKAGHPMSVHLAEPVLRGEKWVCIQWIRHDQSDGRYRRG